MRPPAPAHGQGWIEAPVAIPDSRFPIPAGRQAGYTLIEVIVAFGVLALGLTLLLGTLSGATRQVRHADVAGRAALHAQSLLDQAGIGESLQPGQTDGELEDGFYRWTLDVEPYLDPGAPPPGPEALAAPQLMQLVLTVRWGASPRERLQLATLRLVAPDPLAGMGAVP
jgi:general secretion pathway protein I